MIRPGWFAPVHRKRPLPVRRDRNQPESAGLGEKVRLDKARHALAAGEPGQQRGHLQRGIGPQQLGQRATVGVLDGRGEPVQHRPPVRLGGLGQLVLGGQRLRELGPGPPHAAVDRGGRGAQQVCHLGGRPFQHIPQDQHRALPGGQVLQRRDEGQPDTRPRGRRRGRIVAFPGQQRAGKRLQPRHLRPRHQRRVQVLRRPAQPRRQRPAAPPLDRGQAYVGRDPVQPGPHRRTALKPSVGPPRPQVRLLHQVLGVGGRAQHPVAVSQQLPPELAGQTGEVFAARHRPPPRPRPCQPGAGSMYRPGARRGIVARRGASCNTAA